MPHTLSVIDGYDIPTIVDATTAYRLLPKCCDEAYYRERTDRNIGWITAEEQTILQNTVIGIAGCGGMGGKLAEILLRLGVGEIRIADNEVFDVSNINRQFAACRTTIGRSKAIETAKRLRNITDDSTIAVYPQGICEDTVRSFITGCDVICDEIEFWCVGHRILLHRSACEQGVPLFVCNTIGFGSHIFFFTPKSAEMESCLDMSYHTAKALEEKIKNKSATFEEKALVMKNMIRGLFPEWPEYSKIGVGLQNRAAQADRLIKEGKGPILATNPPMAAGFLADRILLYLLRNSLVARDIEPLPVAPGYLYFDAAKMRAVSVKGASS